MSELHFLANQLLAVRRKLDPLDDAFAMLNRNGYTLPALTEQFLHESIKELESIERRLSEVEIDDVNIEYEIVKSQLFEAKAKCNMRLWGTFVVGYDHSPLGRIGGLLASLKVETNEDRVSFIKIFNSIDTYIDSCCNQLINSYTNGRAPLASNVYSAIERWNKIIANNGNDLIPPSLDKELNVACKKIFEVKVVPSILRYCDVLMSIADGCRSDEHPGLCYISEGKQNYVDLVKINTDNFAHPEQIFNLGLTETTRIKNEIELLQGNSVESFATDPNKFNNYTSEAEFMQDLYELISKVDQQFENVFSFSAFGAIRIEMIPSHLALNSPAAYYVPGSGNSSAGILYINPSSMIGEPKGSVNAVIYHETLPGHHAQFEYIRKLSLPDFRKSSWFNCYIEGWALYVEDLAAELGLYTTKQQKLGKLNQEIFRAARLVVDTGIHYFGWSKKKAISYLIDNTNLSVSKATNEIERYIEYPAQALSYATGKFHLLALRKQCQVFEGDSFNMTMFHHRILKHGAVPIPALANKVMSEIGRC